MVLQTDAKGYKIVGELDLGLKHAGLYPRRYELSKLLVNGGQCEARGAQTSCDTCAGLATQICVQIRQVQENIVTGGGQNV